MNIELVSVNVGMPQPLGLYRDQIVVSGTVKSPVSSTTVNVGATNIAGDGQADLRVHGGADKAVYAYSRDHWQWWESENRLSCTIGTFGENLTLSGASEETVSIGDRFRWGAVLLEVSQPRGPCYKLGLHTRRPDVPSIMTVSARCGFYLRVLEEGEAPTAGKLIRVQTSGGPNVKDAFAAAYYRDVSRESRMMVHNAPGLASSWRENVARRLGETSSRE